MTNWASVTLPKSMGAACTPQALASIRARSAGIFREDLSLSAFVRSFSVIAPATVANQRDRWRHFLQLAEMNRLDERPAFNSPYPATHFTSGLSGRTGPGHAAVSSQLSLSLSRSRGAQRYWRM